MKKGVYSLILALALMTAYAVSQSYPQGQPPPSGVPDASQGTSQPGDPTRPGNPPANDSMAPDAQAQAQADAERQKIKVQDEALHGKVQTQLASDPAFANVKVDVKNNGEVKLKGKVASD